MRLFAFLFCAALAGPAAANPLTDLLIDEDPCGDLPGLDYTDRARVDSASIELEGETMFLRATGNVRCKTSGNAFLTADASARIRLSARVDFDGCRVRDVEVRLDDFGGSAGSVLELGREAIEALLTEEVEESLKQACEDLAD